MYIESISEKIFENICRIYFGKYIDGSEQDTYMLCLVGPILLKIS